jgi:hypothetical protein
MAVTELQFSDTSIYDEIYGYIPLTQVELKLVNHVLFQRLNHIKQLGAAYRVFPGAQHTRFSHSLGVMHIMDRILGSPNLFAHIPVEDRQKLRVAALLHDIGHYPFSHVIETVMTEHHTIGERKHEKLGEYVLAKSSIADILKANNLDPLEIGQIVTGQSPEPLFNQLMSSELDADRIDYLLRDSIHTGVAYGKFDLNRLIHTLSLDKDGQLCVEKSGMHAAEGYIIGRYLMWAVVYTHRVTNAFEELIENIYSKCAGSELPTFDQIYKLVTEKESVFARFDDNAVFKIIHDGVSEKTVNEMCEMFMKREVLAVAKEAQEISEDGKGEREYFLLDEFKKEDKMQELANRSGIPREWIFHNSSRTQLPSLKPLIERDPSEEEQIGREMSKALRIVDKSGNSVPLANAKSSIVYYLRNMSLDKVRIYTREKFQETLKSELIEEIKGV